MLITNKSHLMLEVGRSTAAAVDSTGDAYTTPSKLRATLGYLALSRIIAGKCKGTLRLDASSSAGSADVELRDGAGNVLGSETVDLSSGTETPFNFDVDLSALDYGTKLLMALNVTAAADAGRTAQLDAAIEVEVPIVEC